LGLSPGFLKILPTDFDPVWPITRDDKLVAKVTVFWTCTTVDQQVNCLLYRLLLCPLAVERALDHCFGYLYPVPLGPEITIAGELLKESLKFRGVLDLGDRMGGINVD
jgi:hypothetical protein